MALSAGIIGLPNVGKSTLWSALCSGKAAAENYPFCTIEANHGVVAVPDDRLNRIAARIVTGKVVPAFLELIDIAGLVKGASGGAGLGNQFLGHILLGARNVLHFRLPPIPAFPRLRGKESNMQSCSEVCEVNSIMLRVIKDVDAVVQPEGRDYIVKDGEILFFRFMA